MLEHDRPWPESLIDQLPARFCRTAREYAALPRTRAAKAMAEGRLRRYAILVDHPSARWEVPQLQAA